MRDNRSVVRLENFSPGEWLCRCGCGKDTDERLKLRVQAFLYLLESIYKQPTRCIISGPARCTAHNKAAKGAANSYHMGMDGKDEGPGAAVDAVIQRNDNGIWLTIPKEYLANHAAATKLFGGIGWKKYPAEFTFVHFDLGPVRWF